jgi:peroxiredoxin
MPSARSPIAAGERAPELVLPAVNREGDVSLAGFRGQRAVMIGFFRGLHGPVCRRQIAQLGAARPTLLEHGAETLAVVNTPLDNARLYFRHRPTTLTVLSDPDCASHRAFGVPEIGFLAPGDPSAPRWPSKSTVELFAAARINPTGELDAPAQPMEANEILNAKDGFQLTEADRGIVASHGTQLTAHFLIDREGIVRWCWVEAPNSPSELCRFPDLNDMLAQVRALS